jgi:hypothetical protein
VRADYVHTLARLHQPPPVHILRSLCPVCLGANIEICTVGTDGRDLGNLWVDAGADDAMNEAEPGALGYSCTRHHPSTTLHECIFRNPCALRV